MTGLVEFLKARLDDDEQAARECGGAPWSAEPILKAVHVEAKAIADNKHAWGGLGHVATVLHEQDQQHMARWDPFRVLLEVDAKRRLVGLHPHGFWPTRKGDGHLHCETCDVEDGVIGGNGRYCSTLRLLALPYASHPEYDESWRP